MGRSGYTDYEDDSDDAQWRHIRWQGAIKSAIRGKPGQAFLKEMLAALDALPQKRLIPNVLQQATWDESGDNLIPKKGGDVCAFGAVGRARGISMPAELDLGDEDDPDEMANEVQSLFGTTDALTREILYANDEGGGGRRVPIPNVRRDDWDSWGYDYLPETPEERFARMRRWVLARISKGEHYPNGG